MKHLILPIALFLFSSLQGQVIKEWSQTHDGTANGDDKAQLIRTDKFNNSYVAGTSIGANGKNDIVIIKYDPQGNKLWEAFYNGPTNLHDSPNDIAIDDSCNVYVIGMTLHLVNTSNYYSNYLVVKYSVQGIELWSKIYNGAANKNDVANGIEIDNKGFVYVTGTSTGILSNYHQEVIIAKYQGNGSQVFFKKFSLDMNGMEAYSIHLNQSGDIYIGGTHSNGADTTYGFIGKFDTLGNNMWYRIMTGTLGYEEVGKMKLDTQGNIYTSGRVRNLSSSDLDVKVNKHDKDGNLLWSDTLAFPAKLSDDIINFAIDSKNNVYVCGRYTLADNTTNGYLAKISSSGKNLFRRIFSAPTNKNDIIRDVTIDKKDNVYVTGKLDENTITCKYDSVGLLKWNMAYNSSANKEDVLYGIALDNNEDVLVAGYQLNASLKGDYLTMKYKQLYYGSQQMIFGVRNEKIFGACNTSDGGFATCGITKNAADTTGDMVVYRHDSLYNVVWAKTYGTTSKDSATSIIQAKDGGFFVVGSAGPLVQTPSPPSCSGYITRIDKDGNVLWNRFFGQEMEHHVLSVKTTTDGGCILVADARVNSSGTRYIYAIKIDSTGNITWKTSFANFSSTAAEGNDIIQTMNGEYICVGTMPGGTQVDLFATRIDKNGNILWQNSYDFNNTGGEHIFSVAEAKDSLLYFCGLSQAVNGAAGFGYTLLKAKPNGKLLWSKVMYPPKFGFDLILPCRMLMLSDGNLVLYGRASYKLDAYTFDPGGFHLVKCDSSGNVIWSKTYGKIQHYQDIAQVLEMGNKNLIAFGTDRPLNKSVYRNYFLDVESVNGASACETYNFPLITQTVACTTKVFTNAGQFPLTQFVSPAITGAHTNFTAMTYCSACADLAPDAPLNDTTNLCTGSTLFLDAGNSQSKYLWSTNETTQKINVSSSGKYWVKITNGCGSLTDTTIVVNKLSNVSVSAGADISICAGQSTTLTATGNASSYSWNNSVVDGVSFTSIHTNTYIVTGTASGCSKNDTVIITVKPLPTIIANASATTICAGVAVTLTGSGASTYAWTGGVTNGVSFIPASTNTYTVTGTATNGCTNKATTNLTVLTNCATSIAENNTETDISIYPNPTTGVFNLQMNQTKNAQVKIFNVLGECVYQNTNVSSNIEIDLSVQPDGVYLVQIITEEGTLNKKIVLE